MRGAVFLLLLFPTLALADLGLNLYGLAYHFDRTKAQETGLDNEVIAGVGLRYRVPHSERLQWIFDAGAYHDSGRNTALVAGAGALWKVSECWRLGGALSAFHSNSYNRGRAFVAPVPLVAYEFRRVTLNFVYVPEVADLNGVATLGFWATLWLK